MIFIFLLKMDIGATFLTFILPKKNVLYVRYNTYRKLSLIHIKYSLY